MTFDVRQAQAARTLGWRSSRADASSAASDVCAYDAVYVALAEALEAQLVTADRRLAGAVAAVSNIKVIVVV